MTEKRIVIKATINSTFQAISDFFGYDASQYTSEIATLLQLWNDQGFVEIYQTSQDKAYGFVKDSSENNKGNISPYYIGLYHARLIDGDNDPLIVVKFHETSEGELVDMRFMIHHDDLFGTRDVKRDSSKLRSMWLEIDAKINEGEL